jgi:hypothetical protein
MKDGFGIVTLVALFLFVNLVIFDRHTPDPTADARKAVAELQAPCRPPAFCGPGNAR